MHYSRFWRAASVALVAVVLLVGCGTQTGRVVLFDEVANLNQAQAEQAAAPLTARGAQVAIFLVAQGDDQGNDFAQRLGQAQLLRPDGQIADDAIGLYVSVEPRFSSLRVGSRWSDALPPETLREIREGALNPFLRADAFGDGVSATVNALDVEIGGSSSTSLLKWGGLGALAVALFVAVFRRPISNSPLGHAVARVWALTPWGRRTLDRRLNQARRKADLYADIAQGWVKKAAHHGGNSAPYDLANRLHALSQQHSILSSRTDSDALLALTYLTDQYQHLINQGQQLSPKLAVSSSGYDTSSSYTTSSSSSSSYDSSSSSSSYDSSSSSSSSGSESSNSGSW